MKKKNQIGLNFIFIILSILVIFPFILVLSISFSNESDIVNYGYSVLPRNFDLTAYKYIFSNPKVVVNAYTVTTIFSIVSMIMSVFLMALTAYPLSKKKFRYRLGVSFYLYFTMLFGGGLVPTYILLTQYLHLNDTIWIYIIPGLISPWYVFMIRTFFQGIPEAISESAVIDGASEYTIFMRFVLPLSKPILATISLFVFLGKWNDWMTSMLYINNEKLISLQYLLQRIMLNITLLTTSENRQIVNDVVNIPSETVRMAMAVVVAGPALIVFPFFQKYFVKGITVGSVKG